MCLAAIPYRLLRRHDIFLLMKFAKVEDSGWKGKQEILFTTVWLMN